MRTSFVTSKAAVVAALLGLAGALALASPASATPGPSSPPSTSIAINGTPVGSVSYKGSLLSLTAYQELTVEAEATGGALHLVVDQSAVQRGYVLAFDDAEDASSYMLAHGMGALPSSDRAPKAEAATASRIAADSKNAAGASPLTTQSICSLPNHQGFLYDNLACGGTLFAVLWGDAVPNLGTYGFDNKAESAALGDCIGNMTLFKDNSYGGSTASFHGGDVYTILSTFTNVASSLKTTVTGPCA